MVFIPSKSAEYGKSVWLPHHVNERIEKIIKNSAKEKKKVTPGDVINDLLRLQGVPKYILGKLKDEFDPKIKEIYLDILKYIIEQRKKKD